MSTSVDRALSILALVASAEKPMASSRIAKDLEIPKSTAHGIIRSLVGAGFLHMNASGEYLIGIRTFEVGSAFVRQSNVTDIVAKELVDLTRQLEVTSHFAVLDGADAVYLCKEDSPRARIQLASSLGARLPSHVTAVGKACLAWLPSETVAAHVADGVDLKLLTEELELVVGRGYSTDDGETATGIRCVAAPVFDIGGACGAIGVSYLRGSQVDPSEAVVAAAARASFVLAGGSGR